ncbi:putative Lipase [Taphrina deformans PYCC 5710]|uniref:Lipase n=1 Tax=Taphrina deformans (strain PYCC 5710 / ATCC 11124 / CBS 356.35 / IMI 108563 / JCM 9778 / NBRC 8474) TaxID=1097556 RepID=R4XAW9_TAPDE|nr:putative Lipase [Taphrina deformans PYCC 5710]|eukprot:CCG82968.1 putative Lipase [Taphrina deformans PYCC 5710]
MRITAVATAALLQTVLAAPLDRRDNAKVTVSDSQFSQLVRWSKFASAALATGCNTIYGATKIIDINDTMTDTQGYVARDDTNKQIIVALRGTSSIPDVLTDAATTLVSCTGAGIPYPTDALCHTGFMNSYNSISAQVLSTVKGQVASHPKYSIIVTGHSLGGGLASFAALSMLYNFPQTATTAYSFGQPRTGDKKYAAFHDKSFPNTSGPGTFFRGVHTTDGVPQVIHQGSDGDVVLTGAGLFLPLNNPAATSGYWHHGKEVWQFQEPATAADTVQCAGEENSSCQDSAYIFSPLFGINAEHLTYFGVNMINTSCPAS